MDQPSISLLKSTVVRGIQMLVIGFMMNIGLIIIRILTLIQFFWMVFAKEENGLIAD